MYGQNSPRNERKVGMGWRADGARVIAIVALEEPAADKVTTFTDHTTRPAPARLSISWEIGFPRYGRFDFETGGQVPAEDREIVRRHENDAPAALAAWIDAAWTAHHLNDMHAACDHMTTETLARREGESGPDWQSRMLDTVTCPETGYKWGAAWLARELPADVIATARNVLAAGPAAEIVTEV